MKKIISLVLASIFCSQVVYSSAPDQAALLQQQIFAAQQEAARINAQIAVAESSGGVCAWASWLVGSCFGCCASVAEKVERNPLTSCFCLSLCCCGCGCATSAVIATESLTPGVLAACNMCKFGEYACSLITLGCASGRCGTKKVVKACARCASKIARGAHHACLSDGHME